MGNKTKFARDTPIHLLSKHQVNSNCQWVDGNYQMGKFQFKNLTIYRIYVKTNVNIYTCIYTIWLGMFSLDIQTG